MANSLQTRTGRYVQGGTTDYTPTTLGWWERVVYKRSLDDIPFQITPRYINRPDLIAFDVYGRATLMWVVLQYNNIVDINEELTNGKFIMLPTRQRLETEILTKS